MILSCVLQSPVFPVGKIFKSQRSDFGRRITIMDHEIPSINPSSSSIENLDDKIRPKSLREIEVERLANLPLIPDVPPNEERYSGVLLSDQIQHLANKYRMIWPFNADNLKAASYELSVGSLYGKAGKIYPLSDDQYLEIEPF